MRVLLDQECAAVAGGNAFAGAEGPDPGSDLDACEEAVTATSIAAGAYVGGTLGSAAGGMGVVPGAVLGGGAGQLVAEVAAPPYCRYAYRNRFNDGRGGGGESSRNWDENTSLSGGTPDFYPPQRLQVNTNNF